ncbi:multiple epidermal growth factor-like domains protein 11 isoform X4 [Saccostrea cucullata]|uniref:multiple epidermal growth factor-like domains protein 11 isoform X4 n=1 Tax=Saccostrea cuccullata TaxID=36930 RepID=UPI002ED34E9E
MEVAQMEQARFICLILFLGVSYGKQNGSSLCPTKNNREKCCSGYRMINKTCTECIGFFGEDCMSPCPLNFYGVNCDSECNCTEGEKCNPYVGCLHITFAGFHHKILNKIQKEGKLAAPHNKQKYEQTIHL